MLDFKRMENIHLSDEQLYDLIKQNFRDGYYESAINLMETNPQLDEKILGKIAYNTLQGNLQHLQKQEDVDFKKDLIPLSFKPPSNLEVNKIWFKIIEQVLTWNDLDKLDLSWDELDNLNLTWNELERGEIFDKYTRI